MLRRRDVLRTAGLGLLLGSAGGLIEACGSGPRTSPPPPPVTSGSGGIRLVAADRRRAAGDPALLAPTSSALDGFAARLYAAVAGASGSGNVVISPYSVAVALSMTLAGARGSTASQLEAALETSALGDRWHSGMNTLTSYVDGLAGPVKRADGSKATIGLGVANALFGQSGEHWRSAFLDLLAGEYGAGLRVVDFADPDHVRGLINAWVADHTDDRIKDLIGPGVLTSDARLALVDAISLTAPWEAPFEKGLTRPGDFHPDGGGTVRAQMMRKSGVDVTLTRGQGWQAARIPYAGSTLAMTVVLPDQGRLSDVERGLDSGVLAQALGPGRSASVDLTLPRWSSRTSVSLEQALSSLGVTAAFGPSADFSGMTTQDALSIGAVLHQGWIKVDEDGTEAAAATAAVMTMSGVRGDLETFLVDRPFVYVLHDVAHGTPLFVGRVTDPTR
ncbi:MAG: serpin family protein [Nocardioidaceae bacterium]|nr:serpin family protein [Nocardioidaceae bacterium]MCL2614317.1 serpin family protein [Nocardioidaceae bacterium]